MVDRGGSRNAYNPVGDLHSTDTSKRRFGVFREVNLCNDAAARASNIGNRGARLFLVCYSILDRLFGGLDKVSA
jgi:hypothetical protein